MNGLFTATGSGRQKGRCLGALFTGLALLAAPGAAQAARLLNPLNFEGTTFAQNAALGNAYIPPDTMGAVGLNQFLETTNGSITIYDKTNGAALRRISNQAFWPAVSPNLTNSLGDQRVLFDH